MRHAPLRHRSRRRSGRAFTLVELTLALLGGLIVAIAVVGLSKESNRTFHEEVRNSAAEASLRTAMDRLAADLQRAGYMSTSNIQYDPMIAHTPGAVNLAVVGAANAVTTLRSLASIRLVDSGSYANNFDTASQTLSNTGGANGNSFQPDLIDIGGNFTSTEQFDVEFVGAPPSGIAAPYAGCTPILISPTSAAMIRIAGGAPGIPGGWPTTVDADFRHIFVPEALGSANHTRYMARITDGTGHAQFLLVCHNQGTQGGAGVANCTTAACPNPQPYVYIDENTTPIVYASATGNNGGISASGAGSFINPVQVVRWQIVKAATEVAALRTSLDNTSGTTWGSLDPLKFDLIRSYLQADGALANDSTEVVAEFAADLDFAFTVDTGSGMAASGDAGNPSITTFPFDDSASADTNDYAPTVDGTVNQQTGNIPGAQRIRSVRVRLATRVAQPDRSAAPPAVVPSYSETFAYRYCLNTGGTCTGNASVQWARMRTLTTEVSLPNQSGAFF